MLPRRWQRLLGAGLLAFSTAVLIGSVDPSATSGATQIATRPLPAGRTPSEISKMVCAREAQKDIAETLGVRAKVSKPTWVRQAYSCRYQYPTGAFTLTVKELSSWSQTYAYDATLARRLGKAKSIRNLGQGAYQTTDGWVIVRKDWKILTVDIAALPAQFGVPPTSRSDVAVTVADLILACWAGD